MSVTDRAGSVTGLCNCQTTGPACTSYTDMQQPSDAAAAQAGIR
jgi:hypothetical protein